MSLSFILVRALPSDRFERAHDNNDLERRRYESKAEYKLRVENVIFFLLSHSSFSRFLYLALYSLRRRQFLLTNFAL